MIEPNPLAVAVAQDVLDTIKQPLRPRVVTGTFISVETQAPEAKAVKQACRVCAIGACFLSRLDILNQPVAEATPKIYQVLKEVFTEEQMVLIENAFECRYNDWTVAFRGGRSSPPLLLTGEDITAAIMFGSRYLHHQDRLTAIMNNVIANNGWFIPCRK